MITQQFLPYARQSITTEDLDEVGKALKGDWITRGPQVEAFEKEFASYCGATFAVAFSSGSAALAAAYFAADVKATDRVLTTPNTFISTVGTAMQRGATPLFIDIDRSTGLIDLEQLAFNANQPLSRGRPILVPVHIAGIPFDMEELDRRLTTPDAVIIEDGAHAIGSHYPRQGPKVGSCAWSHMTMFSLHPAKTITTGEGGIITTNDEELCHRLKLFRNNGIERDPRHLEGQAAPWYYEVQTLSNNYNFTEMQAALGRSQLQRIDAFIEKRRALMQLYREKFAHAKHIRLLTDAYDAHVAFHLCIAQIDFAAYGKTREDVMTRLLKEGIGTQVHYIPLYRHPVLSKSCGDISSYFPQMEEYYAQALSLPLYYDLTPEDVTRVVDTLQEVLK